MIVWSGRGILSIVVLIVALFLCMAVLPKGQEDYAFVIASFITAAFSWFLGDKWNNQDPKIVVDEKTGQRINLKSVHALFWIKMQYWGIIFSIIGIVILAQNSIIASIISVVLILGIGIFIYSSKKNKNKIVADSKVNNKDKSQAYKEIETITPVETEEERLKRIKEKEDPSRFMPK